LILAVDPGGAQAAVLGRLAQELPGHEFLSADSSASAVSFVQQQVPDLVLVPLLLPESERAQLQTQLRALSANVQTLTIPMIALDGSASASSVPSSPTEPCDPWAFAEQIRQHLNGPEAAGTGTATADTAAHDEHARRRTHLVAAATALTSWVQGRRAAWSAPAPVAQPADAWTPDSVPVTAVGGEIPSPEWASPPVTEPAAPWPPTPPAPSGPSIGSRAADAARSAQDSIRRWLPRVALLVVAIALVAGGRAYWPSLQALLFNGTLVLESVPDGSEVFIDGTSVGTTPLTAELRGGSYTRVPERRRVGDGPGCRPRPRSRGRALGLDRRTRW
jgi:CheY-like chemotaxis protein